MKKEKDGVKYDIEKVFSCAIFKLKAHVSRPATKEKMLLFN